MSCPDRKAKLMDWVLGELPAGEEAEIRRHVDECAECAQELSRFQRVRDLLQAQLQDREMPSHLVFLPAKAPGPRPGFLAQLWRTAALAAVAAGVFLSIVLTGYARWGRMPSAAAPSSGGLTRAQIEAIVDQHVRLQSVEQQKEFEQLRQNLAADLRTEQARVLVPLAAQLQYVQSAQSLIWQETQKQNALVEVVARNALQREDPSRGRP